MAAYVCSFNQHLMNTYLKEELYCTLKRVPRIRVILDEMPFEGENDELLKYLLTVKQQGKVELILSVKMQEDYFKTRQRLIFLILFCFSRAPLHQQTNCPENYLVHFNIITRSR